MTPYLGDFATGATVRVPWSTNGADGASITRATNGTIRVYKDASTTERTSSAGITDTEDFDSLTGVHWVAIDLSDNTDSGFYATAHDYTVVLAGAVIDGKTVNVPLATFSIQNRYVVTGSTPPTAAAIAAAVLTAVLDDHEDVAETRTVVAALSVLLNKIAPSGAYLQLYLSDGSTPWLKKLVTTDAALLPISSVDGAIAP